MTPAECRQDSRDALYWRVKQVVESGTPLAAVAREPGMPKRATLERWRDNDAEMRARHIRALERQRMVLAEEFVVEADARAEHARGRRRIVALRTQIAARTRLLRLLAEAERKAATAGDATKAGAEKKTASSPSSLSSSSWSPKGDHPRSFGGASAANDDKPARGISDEGVAMLEAAAARFMDATSQTMAVESAPAEDDGPSPDSASSFSSCHPRAPLFEGPRASGPRGGDPRVSFNAETTRGWSASADHDENKIDAPSSPSTSTDDTDDDEPDYAPEDARYRARHKSHSPPSSATEPDATPFTPDTVPGLPPNELDEDGEPRFHRLPLTVGEEEALKARLAGLPPPPPEPEPEFDRYGNRIRRDRPGTFTVRFDLDAAPQRPRGQTMSDYDPFER
jgi:hypothetical protein